MHPSFRWIPNIQPFFNACLGETRNRIEKIILTASGGPFLGKKPNFLVNVKRDHALQHPNWTMGAKISIDSATLMNKGLEMIEAKWLFNLTPATDPGSDPFAKSLFTAWYSLKTEASKRRWVFRI